MFATGPEKGATPIDTATVSTAPASNGKRRCSTAFRSRSAASTAQS